MSRYHVYPTWEKHNTKSADCWCEPSIQEDGLLVVHNAKACQDGGGHSFFNGECLACGDSRGRKA